MSEVHGSICVDDAGIEGLEPLNENVREADARFVSAELKGLVPS